MNALSVREKMLYCPKCQREYEDGSQRFCNSDGGRLVSVVDSADKRSTQQKGVFTSLLGRVPSRFDQDEKLEGASGSGTAHVSPPKLESLRSGKMFKTETTLEPDIKTRDPRPVTQEKSKPVFSTEKKMTTPLPDTVSTKPTPAETPVTATQKPSGRLVEPDEISSGRAPLGDRAINPEGRTAFSTENPDVLIGQSIKGRYLITERLEADEVSVAYSAKDQILEGKKVVVRVLTQVDAGRTFKDKIYAEERISLSHVNHPNVAKVIDSGDLQEGKPFIVTAEPRDSTVAQLLRNASNLNPLRVARIIRQSSYALSEVHQNGVLHRNLKPEHILLTVSDAGIEQVKVTDFCLSDGGVPEDDFEYRAPEQIGGQLPTFASDSYALAVIAYRLLTKRFPFEAVSGRAMLSAQKSERMTKPSELNDQLPNAVDEIFQKALAFDPSRRFSKSREFGEILFQTISGHFENTATGTTPEDVGFAAEAKIPEIESGSANYESVEVEDAEAYSKESPAHYADIHISTEDRTDVENSEEIEEPDVSKPVFAGSNESKWKNRSPEIVAERGFLWPLVPALGGLLFLAIAAVAVWWYFVNQPAETVETEVPAQSNTLVESQGVDSNPNTAAALASDIETPPPARQVIAPAKSVFFENSSRNLSDELESKFLKFSLYYPENWQKKLFDKVQNKVDDKFLDIAISSKDGIPIKQFIVGPYESNGTFKADTELFVKLVAKSNKDSSEALRPGSFEVVSQGATTIQNGRWKAYQVNFESKGKLPDGKTLSIWGRRLWIPAQRPNAKTGFIITMLATSRADDVKSADDVGKKGDLAKILQTFEPVQEF